jgi:hypothetical protein
MKRPYTLYRRPSKQPKTKRIFYVHYIDPDTGTRLNGISTDSSNRATAGTFATDYIVKGKLAGRSKLRFSNFAKDFFVWETSRFIKQKPKQDIDTRLQLLMQIRGFWKSMSCQPSRIIGLRIFMLLIWKNSETVSWST